MESARKTKTGNGISAIKNALYDDRGTLMEDQLDKLVGEYTDNIGEHILYLYPEQGTDLAAARLEAGGLEELVMLNSSSVCPGLAWRADEISGRMGSTTPTPM